MSNCTLHVNNKYQNLIAEDQAALKEIMEDIKKMHSTSSNPESFSKKVKQYLKEIHEDKIKADADELLHAVKSQSNYDRVMKMRAEGVPVAEAIRTFLTPSTHNVDNAGLSWSSVMAKQTIKYQNMIEQGFSKAELDIMAKGALDHEVILEMAGKSLPEHNPLSKKLAGTFSQILDMTHKEKLNVGIMMNKIKNYVFNQSMLHNTDKMRLLAKEIDLPDGSKTNAWVEMQMKDLDHEKSFPYMNTDAEKREYLLKTFNHIMDGADEAVVTNWKVLKEKGILNSSVQAKYSKPRQLHYTPDGLVNQFKQFGDKTLVETMMAEIAKSARDVSEYEILGPRGRNGMDTVIQKVKRDLQAQGNKLEGDARQKFVDEIDSITQAQDTAYLRDINQITNANNKVLNKKVAIGFGAARTFVNSLLLGNVPLSAVTDLAFGVTAQHINGKGFLHSTGDMIKTMLSTIPAEKRAGLVKRMKIAQESALTHMLQVHGAEGVVAKGAAKLNYLYSKVLPVQWQTRLHKAWAANVLGLDLGEWTAKGFKDLDPLAAQGLKKHGISDVDWAALQSMRKDIDGDFHVESDNFHAIPDDLAKDIIAKHKANDPKFIPKTPDQYRAYLEKRFDSYVQEYVHTAIPTPGERVRGLLHGNGQAGEVGHETRKTMTMLKSFMFNQVDVMKKVYRASPNKADKARHLSGMVAGLLVMSYGRDVLEALMEGRETPDPSQPEVIKKAALRSGVGTILADVLMQDTYQGKDTAVISALAGPAFTKAGDALGTAKNVVKKGSVSAADMRSMKKLIPGNNLMYFKLLNHHILEDAAASMGMD